jgi:hypothetical protein
MIPESLSLVYHADWSKHPRKRWQVLAHRQADGSFRATAPQPVGAPENLLNKLYAQADNGGAILLGFDFPIGLPVFYASKAGINSFLSILPELGQGDWAHFFDVAEKEEQISITRPFYPNRPGQTRQQHLTSRLSAGNMNALRRMCERVQEGRRAAAPLFWTMGAQQVGKAAIHGWQELLQPALNNGQATIWPFAGRLSDLLQPGQMIIVETYPAAFYTQMLSASMERGNSQNADPVNGSASGRRLSKRSQKSRRYVAPGILTWAYQVGVHIDDALSQIIESGFGLEPTAEDQFDSFVGLLGMINILCKWGDSDWERRYEPEDPIIREIEGWIFGQEATDAAGAEV